MPVQKKSGNLLKALCKTRPQGLALYDEDNVAACLPGSGPADTRSLSAASLPLVLINRPAQIPVGLTVPGVVAIEEGTFGSPPTTFTNLFIIAVHETNWVQTVAILVRKRSSTFLIKSPIIFHRQIIFVYPFHWVKTND